MCTRKQYPPLKECVRTKKVAKKMQALLLFGVPPSCRGRLWSLAVGNAGQITRELYAINRRRARQAVAGRDLHKEQSTIGTGPSDDPSNVKEPDDLTREDTVHLIALDLPRTFPALSIFRSGGPLHQGVCRCCRAWIYD